MHAANTANRSKTLTTLEDDDIGCPLFGILTRRKKTEKESAGQNNHLEAV
jgi:hypothetical protein